MSMIFSIAWKNVWRNKLRSLILILSISLGLLGGIFYLAFTNGMVRQQVSSTIKGEISNIQIHHPDFLINDEIKYSIDHPSEKLKEIESLPQVTAACSRIKSAAMVSSAKTGTGIFITGIDVEREKLVSNLYSSIVEGDYFESYFKKPIVIGNKLAEKLKVKVRSKIVITIQNSKGDITYGAFRVVGIYKTHNSNYDQSNVFVTKNSLSELIDFKGDKASEIAVLLTHNDLSDTTASLIKQMFSEEINAGSLIIQTWKEVQPALEMMNDMTIQFSLIFVIIILVALSFGIINTMLMAIMERVREIGMLMAIGMNKLKLSLMILIETILLSVTGGFIGILLSWIAIELTGRSGIDLSIVAEGLNSWGYSSFVYPELGFTYYFMIGALVVFTAILASILPARKAIKFKPAEAVRHDV